MSTAKSTLSAMLRPLIYGGKHIAVAIGVVLASFILFLIVDAASAGSPSLIVWGIATVIVYRICRHTLSATH